MRKEDCPHFEQNLDQQESAWGDYLEYLSGFGIHLPEPDFAFSSKVREKMLKRDGYQCVECGSEENLEAAHYDHSKKNKKKYNDINNGRILCTCCHLQDHIDRAGYNGLSENHNNWAIDTLRRKVEGW